jgi:hypothetical protein
MDERNFDRLTVALSGDGSTRRGVLGGLAALLGIAGIGGLDAFDAEAKKGDNKKVKRLRRRLRRQRRKNNKQNGVTIINEGDTTSLLPAGTNLGGLTVQNVLDALGLDDVADLDGILPTSVLDDLVGGSGIVCAADNLAVLRLCATGYCDEASNTCAPCPNGQLCGDGDGVAGLVCCIEGAVCADVGCVLA